MNRNVIMHTSLLLLCPNQKDFLTLSNQEMSLKIQRLEEKPSLACGEPGLFVTARYTMEQS